MPRLCQLPTGPPGPWNALGRARIVNWRRFCPHNGTSSMPLSPATVRSAADSYVDPYLRQSLGQAEAIMELSLAGTTVQAVIELGIPVVGYEPAFRAALLAHLQAALPD